jgi:DNA-binding CsgD family transcriptional regulator/PAS domain-containing protein
MSNALGATGVDAFGGLIGRAYDAVLDQTRWQPLADDIRRAFDSELAVIEVHDRQDPDQSFVVAAGIGEDFLASYREHWDNPPTDAEADPLRNAVLGGATGSVFIDLELQTREESRQREVYRRLAAPWKLGYFMTGVIVNTPAASAFLSLGRTTDNDSFGPFEKQLLGHRLLGHLERSVTLQRRLVGTHSRASVLGAVLDTLPHGVVVFDRHGHAIVVNRAAEQLLADGGALALRGRCLISNSPRCQPALERALAAALAAGPMDPPPAPVVAANLAGGTAVRVTFTALRGRARNGPLEAALPARAACLALLDPVVGAAPAAPLPARFNFTPAEDRLCRLLLAGRSLQAAADLLEVSRNTAKTHLTRVFDKTGVRSQLALINLLRR